MHKFKLKNTIGREELAIANKIIKSGKLSGFKAEWPDGFNGGKYVKKFENYLKKFYGVKYAITVNSWTSGLIAIMGSNSMIMVYGSLLNLKVYNNLKNTGLKNTLPKKYINKII